MFLGSDEINRRRLGWILWIPRILKIKVQIDVGTMIHLTNRIFLITFQQAIIFFGQEDLIATTKPNPVNPNNPENPDSDNCSYPRQLQNPFWLQDLAKSWFRQIQCEDPSFSWLILIFLITFRHDIVFFRLLEIIRQRPGSNIANPLTEQNSTLHCLDIDRIER